MKWLEENWFKMALVILFVVCIVLAFLYQNNRIETEKQVELNNRSVTCQKLASQKKADLLKDNEDLVIGNIFEYKYNSTHKVCILAFSGYYKVGSMSATILRHNVFEIDNLSTGESLMSERVNPGDSYRTAYEKFTSLRNEYIGSVQD